MRYYFSKSILVGNYKRCRIFFNKKIVFSPQLIDIINLDLDSYYSTYVVFLARYFEIYNDTPLNMT